MSIDSVEMPKKPCSGLTPIAIPVVKTTDEGVSVEYAPSPDKKWFVLRASYGREDMVADEMIRLGHYAYVAKRYKWVVIKDKEVEVVDGPFKGVHGLVIRAKGQRRVMLRLLSTDGMPLIDHIATAFVPRSYMRRVEK